MALAIKICGLSSEETIEAAIENGAAYLGFVFFSKSPRHLTVERGRALSNFVAGRVPIVAVTVNATQAELEAIIAAVRPAYLQLHGAEDQQQIATLKQRYELPIIKALAVNDACDLVQVAEFKPYVDRFLFDAKPQAKMLLPGGNGRTFNWQLLNALDSDIEYFLSGGLNAQNIASAIRQTRALGFDVSSGVESSVGVKDKNLIDNFFTAARRGFSRRARGEINDR